MGSRTKSALVAFLGCNELDTDINVWWWLVAQFVGTLSLVLAGTFSLVWAGCDAIIGLNVIGSVLIAVGFGVIVSTVVDIIGDVSSGHFDPAVSIWMLATGKMSLVRYLLYALCQSAGAIVCAALFKVLTPGALQESLGAMLVTDGVSEVQAFGMVFLSAFWLVSMVCAVSDPNRPEVRDVGSLPLVIMLAVAFCDLVAITSSGSSKKPARSFGPAVIKNIWSGHWVYWLWLGPNLGGVAAAILYHFAFNAPKPVPSVELLQTQRSS